MRVVLDTNVLISAFLWQGTPKNIFVPARENVITICVNAEILAEFERVLTYPKFKERLYLIDKTPFGVVNELTEIVKYFPSHSFPDPQIKADPSDDIFLSCALASRASFIISGDKHLLRLKEFNRISIFTPRQFLSRDSPMRAQRAGWRMSVPVSCD